eukprot:TRINITY_DN4704_c0_g1_i1.p1 TRINITY_DN4704_c0_g1~~TRINITY_DN4704_c0_g1_i1.p1  ORF type:complete len:633 (-),score=187.34 TRINITY_DN4704_c0_g1_i1:64-1962(-)
MSAQISTPSSLAVEAILSLLRCLDRFISARPPPSEIISLPYADRHIIKLREFSSKIAFQKAALETLPQIPKQLTLSGTLSRIFAVSIWRKYSSSVSLAAFVALLWCYRRFKRVQTRLARTRNITQEGKLVGEGGETGFLYQLYPKKSSSKKFSNLDIVLVHGIGGDHYRTWIQNVDDDSSKIPMWVRDVLPEHILKSKSTKRLRVFSLRYDQFVQMSIPTKTRQTTVVEPSRIVDLLLHSLSVAGLAERVVFLCQDFGGLLVKAMLQKAVENPKQPYSSLAEKSCGVLFFATPQREEPQEDRTLSFGESQSPKAAYNSIFSTLIATRPSEEDYLSSCRHSLISATQKTQQPQEEKAEEKADNKNESLKWLLPWMSRSITSIYKSSVVKTEKEAVLPPDARFIALLSEFAHKVNTPLFFETSGLEHVLYYSINFCTDKTIIPEWMSSLPVSITENQPSFLYNQDREFVSAPGHSNIPLAVFGIQSEAERQLCHLCLCRVDNDTSNFRFRTTVHFIKNALKRATMIQPRAHPAPVSSSFNPAFDVPSAPLVPETETNAKTELTQSTSSLYPSLIASESEEDEERRRVDEERLRLQRWNYVDDTAAGPKPLAAANEPSAATKAFRTLSGALDMLA